MASGQARFCEQPLPLAKPWAQQLLSPRQQQQRRRQRWRQQQRQICSAPSTPVVPEVDIRPLLDGGAESKRRVAREIGRACEDIGFFSVSGHAVRPDAIQDCWDQVRPPPHAHRRPPLAPECCRPDPPLRLRTHRHHSLRSCR